MNSSPKIIVLKLREIVYTVILLFLTILLILCLILMFSKKETKIQNTISSEPERSFETETSVPETTRSSSVNTKRYVPGIYTSTISLGESSVDVAVSVSSDQISSIRLINLTESIAASYPLLSPALTHISEQILEKQNLEHITAPQDNKYTSQLLLSAIADSLALAQNVS